MALLLKVGGHEWLRKFPWIVRRQMIGIQNERMIEDHLYHCAERQLRFRTARE